MAWRQSNWQDSGPVRASLSPRRWWRSASSRVDPVVALHFEWGPPPRQRWSRLRPSHRLGASLHEGDGAMMQVAASGGFTW